MILKVLLYFTNTEVSFTDIKNNFLTLSIVIRFCTCWFSVEVFSLATLTIVCKHPSGARVYGLLFLS